ncbi:hypothetical protein EG861_14030, partial [Enterococcus faecalis]
MLLFFFPAGAAVRERDHGEAARSALPRRLGGDAAPARAHAGARAAGGEGGGRREEAAVAAGKEEGGGRAGPPSRPRHWAPGGAGRGEAPAPGTRLWRRARAGRLSSFTAAASSSSLPAGLGPPAASPALP